MFLEFLVVGEAVEDFLLRLVPDGAGVVEDQVSFFDGFHLAVAFVDQRADDFFGVMGIHLAAKGFEVERLLRIACLLWNPRHIGKYNAGRASGC